MTETATKHEAHKKTGLPVQSVPSFEVGDLVTESINGDSYPGVVVHATAKTVYVASVRYQVGNVQPNDVPGYNGYGDSATLVVDEESVKEAVAKGKEGGKKYVLHVSAQPVRPASMSGREEMTYGSKGFHRAGWRSPNGGYFHLSSGASYRQDPHF